VLKQVGIGRSRLEQIESILKKGWNMLEQVGVGVRAG